MCLLTTLFCVPFHCSLVRTCRRPSAAFAVDFDGPALPRGVDTSGNIFDMLGRLNLSSLHSNIQHLATTISGHSPSLVADALCNQPAHVSYNQNEPSLSVSIGSNRSSMSRAVQLRGQTYLSRGWAASHLQLDDGRTQHAASSDTNLPLLERVSEQCSAYCVMLHASGRALLLSRALMSTDGFQATCASHKSTFCNKGIHQTPLYQHLLSHLTCFVVSLAPFNATQ